MSGSLLDRLTPRASPRARLGVASLVWSGSGLGLLAAGLTWIARAPGTSWMAALPLALAVGYFKGRFVLAPRAAANASRIAGRGEDRCVGGAFGWGSWGLAGAMMAIGFALRHSPLPRPWLGLLYAAIGASLITASLTSWSRWLLAGHAHGRAARG